jgi:hypothetical protein
MQIAESVAVVPGYTSDTRKKAKIPFSFERSQTGEYTVWFPANLESFADNWLYKVGVVAAQLLGASIQTCEATTEDYKYFPDCVEYLHGLAAAFKRQSVDEPVGSGLFLHGFMWACSTNLKKLPNPDMFRTSWHTPVYPLTKKEAWAGTAGGSHYNVWHALCIEAAKFIQLPSPEKFCKSYEELSKMIKHSFHYEAKSVFSEYEIKEMSDFIRNDREKLEEFRSSLRHPTKELVLNWKAMRDEASKGVSAFDERVSTIGSRRAMIIFPKRKAKGKPERGLTREMRVSELDFGAWIQATNPTGLFNDDRVEFSTVSKRDEKSNAEAFLSWSAKHFSVRPPGFNPLLEEWIRVSEAHARRVVAEED